MSLNNPYQTPESLNLTQPVQDEVEIASRWLRLGGALVDFLLSLILLTPIMYMGFMSLTEVTQFASFFGWIENNQLIYGVIIVLVSAVWFIVIHGYLLANYGQTVGKRLLGTRIVNRQTNQILPLREVVLRRYLPQWIVSAIPGVSTLLPLIDVLFIFSKDKRCLHDLIADTKVIVVK